MSYSLPNSRLTVSPINILQFLQEALPSLPDKSTVTHKLSTDLYTKNQQFLWITLIKLSSISKNGIQINKNYHILTTLTHLSGHFNNTNTIIYLLSVSQCDTIDKIKTLATP